MQWLHSTCRDELNAAERATFQDFVCLAAVSPKPGSFKFVSPDSLARTLNTSVETIRATIDKCTKKNRITLKNEPEGTVCTIIKWPDYQSFKSKKPKARCPISFNFETEQWEGITEKHTKAWAEAYPSVNIDLFLRHMAQWLMSNPDRKKSNYCRALTNWLKKEQDGGGSKRGPTGKADMEEEKLRELIRRRKEEQKE